MSTQAISVTEASIAQSGRNASDELKRQLAGAALGVAETKPDFTTDDVWVEFENRGGSKILTASERSTIGYVMREGVKLGYFSSTPNARRSNRPSSHRRLLTIFSSNRNAMFTGAQEGNSYIS